ncbi:hypothetical protein CTJ10_12665, partial [Staphylococcus epidermidis]
GQHRRAGAGLPAARGVPLPVVGAGAELLVPVADVRRRRRAGGARRPGRVRAAPVADLEPAGLVGRGRAGGDGGGRVPAPGLAGDDAERLPLALPGRRAGRPPLRRPARPGRGGRPPDGADADDSGRCGHLRPAVGVGGARGPLRRLPAGGARRR